MIPKLGPLYGIFDSYNVLDCEREKQFRKFEQDFSVPSNTESPSNIRVIRGLCTLRHTSHRVFHGSILNPIAPLLFPKFTKPIVSPRASEYQVVSKSTFDRFFNHRI
ncbi:uncharacterized protein LOC143147938 [Ptiloglossa arizonensis]|uniref:uncharacterized protein LOC143147938 n=1 Tax=Ptiloglossa arizonensis TaxID=3350558 RepID=UPI003F9EE5CC